MERNSGGLPLDEEYKESIRSYIADIINSGGRWGGAITAAMFLKEFAEDTPWIHLDIAGTAWMEEAETVDRERAVGDRGTKFGGVRQGIRRIDLAQVRLAASHRKPHRALIYLLAVSTACRNWLTSGVSPFCRPPRPIARHM